MAGGSPEFTFLTPDDLQNLPDATWLVANIIPENAVCVLYGDPGSGKSFVALSLALSISGGHKWCGKVTARGPVLYVAAEGLRGFKLRVPAYQLKHEFTAKNIRYLDRGFDLRCDVESLLRALTAAGIKPVLIIIDTLARHMSGADENNTKDMSATIAGIERLRQELQCTVLIIHHTRKGGGIERGSSALRGAADVMIECASSPSDKHLITLKCEKMKDAAPFPSCQLGLELIQLGPSSSSLAVATAMEALKAGAERASGKKTLEILDSQFGSTGATYREWLDAFMRETEQSKSTFDRSLRSFKQDGSVREEAGKYYPNGPGGGVGVTSVSP
jgi:hypothetical protein